LKIHFKIQAVSLFGATGTWFSMALGWNGNKMIIICLQFIPVIDSFGRGVILHSTIESDDKSSDLSRNPKSKMKPKPLYPNPADVVSQINSTRRPRQPSGVPFVPPHDATEKALAEYWSEILSIREIGVNDNFFEIDGDSVQMTQIASRMRMQLGIELTLGDFVDHPTVAGLAKLVRERYKE
jgi:acyl carrier protein